MKVYGYFYNPCIHESADGLVSLHATKELADRAMANAKQDHYDDWVERNNFFKGYDPHLVETDYIMHDWQVHSVQELEVEDA